MISLAPFILVAILGMVVWAIVDHRRRATRGDIPYRGDPTEPDARVTTRPAGELPATSRMQTLGRLHTTLEQWQEAGLITADQMMSIEHFEAERAGHPAAPPRRIPVVAEALGYIGGSLGTVGLSLLVAHYWVDFPTVTRVAITAAAAVILTVAGLLVPHHEEASLERLRQFVWIAAGAATGLMAGVVAKDVADAHDARLIALVVAGSVMVHSAVLWRISRRPAQQFVWLVSSLVIVGTLVAQWAAGGPSGLAVWLLGLWLVGFGIWQVLPESELTILVGGVGAMVGAALVAGDWHGAGMLMGVATAGTFGALALARRPVQETADRTVLGVLAALGTLATLPETLVWYSRDAGIVTGLTLWSVGVVLLAAARTRAVRLPITTQILGGLAVLGGAALTGAQSVAFATIFGAAIAVILIGLGTLPDHALLSVVGSAGLLVNVPWAIRYFFPGEGRVPLLILVSGVLIVAVAVWLTHLGGEIRHEFRLHLHHH